MCGGFSIIVDECRVSYPHLTSAKDVICSDAYINVMQYTNCFREGLMSYKQFIQELEDDILPAEAERRYILGSKICLSQIFFV